MRYLGIIPARGGSKGVPGKNIKRLGGKPLLAYTAESALSSKELDLVVLSTESEEIAKVGQSLGLEVPFLRPKALASDNTPTIEVVMHAISFYKAKGVLIDHIILLQPTSPFRANNLIANCIKTLEDKNADSLISVRHVPKKFNPHWIFEPNAHGYLKIATGEKDIIPRRQELPDSFYRDGQIYITKTDVINRNKSFFGERLTFYLNHNSGSNINIDTLDDWAVAEDYVSRNLI